ncbi:MAG: S1 RNA-binding domain-containing protein [Candidatus Kapaibacterium sp.]
MSNEELKNTENSQPETEISSEETSASAEQSAETVNETPVAVAAEVKVEAPAETATEPITKTEEPKAAESTDSKPEASKSEDSETEDKAHYNSVVSSLEKLIGTEDTINVEVIAKAKGGLRVVYDSVPLFLPASHFSLEKNVKDEKLEEAVNTKFDVKVTEVKQIGDGKIVIVSRKELIQKELWEKIKVGEDLTGKVSSITNFGVFLDLGGVEGLIHVSRLSHSHIDNPKNHFHKGDELTVKVVEVDQKNGKITLSKKALEDSPWKGAEEKYKAGESVTGKIKRLTDFGAYVELEPGVEGLLRVSELSWAKRINKPSDMLEENQEIELKVIQISEEKGQAALSLKQNQENPWPALAEKYSKGAEASGKVEKVFDKGAIIRINDEVDAFMPISRISALKVNDDDQPLKVGAEIAVKVIDSAAKDESLVVSPVLSEEQQEKMNNRREKRERAPRKPVQNIQTSGGSISFGDLLSKAALDKLTKDSK